MSFSVTADGSRDEVAAALVTQREGLEAMQAAAADAEKPGYELGKQVIATLAGLMDAAPAEEGEGAHRHEVRYHLHASGANVPGSPPWLSVTLRGVMVAAPEQDGS